jgi:type III secretory pathway component EscV
MNNESEYKKVKESEYEKVKEITKKDNEAWRLALQADLGTREFFLKDLRKGFKKYYPFSSKNSSNEENEEKKFTEKEKELEKAYEQGEILKEEYETMLEDLRLSKKAKEEDKKFFTEMGIKIPETEEEVVQNWKTAENYFNEKYGLSLIKVFGFKELDYRSIYEHFAELFLSTSKRVKNQI